MSRSRGQVAIEAALTRYYRSLHKHKTLHHERKMFYCPLQREDDVFNQGLESSLTWAAKGQTQLTSRGLVRIRDESIQSSQANNFLSLLLLC